MTCPTMKRKFEEVEQAVHTCINSLTGYEKCLLQNKLLEARCKLMKYEHLTITYEAQLSMAKMDFELATSDVDLLLQELKTGKKYKAGDRISTSTSRVTLVPSPVKSTLDTSTISLELPRVDLTFGRNMSDGQHMSQIDKNPTMTDPNVCYNQNNTESNFLEHPTSQLSRFDNSQEVVNQENISDAQNNGQSPPLLNLQSNRNIPEKRNAYQDQNSSSNSQKHPQSQSLSLDNSQACPTRSENSQKFPNQAPSSENAAKFVTSEDYSQITCLSATCRLLNTIPPINAPGCPMYQDSGRNIPETVQECIRLTSECPTYQEQDRNTLESVQESTTLTSECSTYQNPDRNIPKSVQKSTSLTSECPTYQDPDRYIPESVQESTKLTSECPTYQNPDRNIPKSVQESTRLASEYPTYQETVQKPTRLVSNTNITEPPQEYLTSQASNNSGHYNSPPKSLNKDLQVNTARSKPKKTAKDNKTKDKLKSLTNPVQKTKSSKKQKTEVPNKIDTSTKESHENYKSLDKAKVTKVNKISLKLPQYITETITKKIAATEKAKSTNVSINSKDKNTKANNFEQSKTEHEGNKNKHIQRRQSLDNRHRKNTKTQSKIRCKSTESDKVAESDIHILQRTNEKTSSKEKFHTKDHNKKQNTKSPNVINSNDKNTKANNIEQWNTKEKTENEVNKNKHIQRRQSLDNRHRKNTKTQSKIRCKSTESDKVAYDIHNLQGRNEKISFKEKFHTTDSNKNTTQKKQEKNTKKNTVNNKDKVLKNDAKTKKTKQRTAKDSREKLTVQTPKESITKEDRSNDTTLIIESMDTTAILSNFTDFRNEISNNCPGQYTEFENNILSFLTDTKTINTIDKIGQSTPLVRHHTEYTSPEADLCPYISQDLNEDKVTTFIRTNLANYNKDVEDLNEMDTFYTDVNNTTKIICETAKDIEINKYRSAIDSEIADSTIEIGDITVKNTEMNCETAKLLEVNGKTAHKTEADKTKKKKSEFAKNNTKMSSKTQASDYFPDTPKKNSVTATSEESPRILKPKVFDNKNQTKQKLLIKIPITKIPEAINHINPTLIKIPTTKVPINITNKTNKQPYLTVTVNDAGVITIRPKSESSNPSSPKEKLEKPNQKTIASTSYLESNIITINNTDSEEENIINNPKIATAMKPPYYFENTPILSSPRAADKAPTHKDAVNLFRAFSLLMPPSPTFTVSSTDKDSLPTPPKVSLPLPINRNLLDDLPLPNLPNFDHRDTINNIYNSKPMQRSGSYSKTQRCTMFTQPETLPVRCEKSTRTSISRAKSTCTPAKSKKTLNESAILKVLKEPCSSVSSKDSSPRSLVHKKDFNSSSDRLLYGLYKDIRTAHCRNYNLKKSKVHCLYCGAVNEDHMCFFSLKQILEQC